MCSQFLLRGRRFVPVSTYSNISSRLGQLLGVPVPCANLYDCQHRRLSSRSQLRKLPSQQVLHLQHPVRHVSDQLHLSFRHRVHQRLRVRRQHVRCQLWRQQPDVQCLSAWVLLPGWRFIPLPSEFLLHWQHGNSGRLPCALHFVGLFQLLFRLPVRRWILHERWRVLDVWIWDLCCEGDRGRLQRVSW